MNLLAAGNSLHSATTIMKNGYLSKWLKTPAFSHLGSGCQSQGSQDSGEDALGFGPANLISIRHPSSRTLRQSLGRGKDQVRTGGGFA